MINEVYKLSCKGSLDYARLELFIQQPYNEIAVKKRPMIILCPGGGYEYTSAREAEPIAYRFMSEGYNCAILYYSCHPAKYPTSLLELAESVRHIRKNASKWHFDKNAIIVQGCSAGGHLAASYSCFWKSPFIAEGIGLKEDVEVLRPNGQMLCYPVITSGKYAHVGSFDHLVGNNKTLRKKLSLEYAVNNDTPVCFIWHTYPDESVPVENSLLYVNALREKNINTEFHMYSVGGHGLSLSQNITMGAWGGETPEAVRSWTALASEWLSHTFPITVKADRK